MKNISRLSVYRKNGVFPKNLDFSGEFVPYFKDAFGVPCAVAHLMEQSGERVVVASVAATNNHVYVNDIKKGPVLEWIRQSGLTQAEAACIQPTYGYGSIAIIDPVFVVPIKDFVLPVLVNVVAMTGLSVALLFLLFRSYLLSLYASLGKKRFFTVMVIMLVTLNSIATSFYYYLINTLKVSEMFLLLLYFIAPFVVMAILFGLLKLLLYLPTKKKNFIVPLITYPLAGVVFILIPALPIIILLALN